MNPPNDIKPAKPPPSYEPEMVELTEDWMDFDLEDALPKGTILMRAHTGQYAQPGYVLGMSCIPSYSGIKSISRPLRAKEIEAWHRAFKLP